MGSLWRRLESRGVAGEGGWRIGESEDRERERKRGEVQKGDRLSRSKRGSVPPGPEQEPGAVVNGVVACNNNENNNNINKSDDDDNNTRDLGPLGKVASWRRPFMNAVLIQPHLCR